MTFRINTNVEALNAQRNLSAMGSAFAKSVERLSSGLRITRAADDAAGLAISEKLRAQVSGLNQARRNAQDGVSMVQTAEGALTEVHSMLQRIRELAVEAANSTLSAGDAASIGTEIAALRDEIDRIAGATTFNGQHLLDGALNVAQSGGTLAVGTALATGHNAVIASVDVSGARAGATYTLTSQAGGRLTLSDGLGISQQVALSTIGVSGAEAIDFGAMGVRITVVGDPAKTAAELATDISTTPSTLASVIAGFPASDLRNGDTIAQTDTAAVLVQNVNYYPSGAIDAPQPTAVASTGVTPGTITLSVTALGHVTGSLGGENFAGDLAAFNPGHSDTIVLTGTRGNTITMTYHQSATAGSLSDEAIDFTGSSMTFVAGPGTATVSALACAPTTGVGTYAFTSSAPGSLTLTGPDGVSTVGVVDMGANATQLLTFGNISFTLTSDGNGMSAAAIVSNLLRAANDTIVVGTTGSAGDPRTITTGAGSSANFQIGANASDFLRVSFADARTSNTSATDGYGTLSLDITAFETATGTGNGIVAAAQTLITSVDGAIGFVSTTRGNLGAVQNRLDHTTASISVASENLNASQSRIRDLDVASEMVFFTKTRILAQAGTAILAQANSAPRSVLALLRSSRPTRGSGTWQRPRGTEPRVARWWGPVSRIEERALAFHVPLGPIHPACLGHNRSVSARSINRPEEARAAHIRPA